MRLVGRIFRPIVWTAGILITVFVVGPLGSLVYEQLYDEPLPRTIDTIQRSWPWGLAAALAIAAMGIVSYKARRSTERRSQFAFVRPASDLAPVDFGFQVMDVGGASDDPTRRPLYPTYKKRRFSTFDPFLDPSHADSYTETELLQIIRNGRGFVLVGQPLEGKSRTLFEVVRRATEFTVVKPLRDRPAPASDAFCEFRGKQVVLLLEDLNDYVGSPMDVRSFCESLSERCGTCVIVATCRDGAELAAVRGTVSGVSRVYEAIPLKLSITALSDGEKSDLSRRANGEPLPGPPGLYPTPGSIVMSRALDAMRLRFQMLSRDERDVLRALGLLMLTGVVPFTRARVSAVVRRIFSCSPDLEGCLEVLANQSFIHHPATREPINPEPAYLMRCVDYARSNPETQDHGALEDILADMEDADGLVLLAATVTYVFEAHDRAEALIDRATSLRPDHPEAWFVKGWALWKNHRLLDAIQALDLSLALSPDNAGTWSIKGLVLHELGRHEDALACYDTMLNLKPEDERGLTNRAVMLGHLGRNKEALADLDVAARIQPDSAWVWVNKAVALRQTKAYQESLAASDEAIRLHPEMASAWYGKAMTLREMGEFDAEVELCDQFLSIRPDDVEASRTKALALVSSGRYETAIAAFDRLLQLTPDDPDAWHAKGAPLHYLRRHLDEIAVYDRALALNPENLVSLFNKSLALSHLGRHEEAIEVIDRLLDLESSDAAALAHKGSELTLVGRYEDSLHWYDLAIMTNPDVPNAWYGKADTLHQMERITDEAQVYVDLLRRLPGESHTVIHKTQRLIQLRRLEESLAILDAILAVTPGEAEAWYEKGRCLTLSERHEEALKAYEEAIRLRPHNPWAWASKGSSLALSPERRSEGIQWLRRAWAARHDPGSKGLEEILSGMFQALGHSPEV